jgi:hypothetical protein
LRKFIHLRREKPERARRGRIHFKLSVSADCNTTAAEGSVSGLERLLAGRTVLGVDAVLSLVVFFFYFQVVALFDSLRSTADQQTARLHSRSMLL